MMLLQTTTAACKQVCILPRYSIQRRSLTLDGKRAVDFLEPKLKDTLKKSFHHINEKRSTSKDSLAILIHADRRGILVPPSADDEGSPTLHYGTSLIACPYDLLDRHSPELGNGDLGILKIQRDQPDRCFQMPILPKRYYLKNQTRTLSDHKEKMGLNMLYEKHIARRLAGLLQRLIGIFKANEMIWLTAQLTASERSVNINAPFFEFDDFAVHRVEALKEINEHARSERDSNTAQAEDGGLFYKKLNNGGKVGSFGYGAGNAMATMDGLAMAGAIPANFLDGGGGANVANAKLAIETLHRDSDVKSIFVNTFGGLTRCSLVAEGIIQAVKENDIQTPMTIRLMGTEADEAKEMLRATKLPFIIEDDFKTAAKLAVEQAK